MRKVRRMLSMAKVGPKDVVYDLGSGDGRILITAVREFGARSVGIEADPLRFIFSRILIKLLRLGGQAKVIWGNFYNKKLNEATVITVFLFDSANAKLKEKFERELKLGTRIISYHWPFKGWRNVEADEEEEIFLYQIGKMDQE
jgi:predicted RNA methylase